MSVRARRGAYWTLLVLAILVFAFSMVDIFLLEEEYFLFVILAYVLLFIIALLLLIGGGSVQREPRWEEPKRKALASEEHLHCPSCAHVFYMGTPKNTKKWKRGVTFTCPECGHKGVLPPANATATEKVVPAGEVQSKEFHCGHCGEGWSVGVIGHRLKKKPSFDACPSCGTGHDIHVV